MTGTEKVAPTTVSSEKPKTSDKLDASKDASFSKVTVRAPSATTTKIEENPKANTPLESTNKQVGLKQLISDSATPKTKEPTPAKPASVAVPETQVRSKIEIKSPAPKVTTKDDDDYDDDFE